MPRKIVVVGESGSPLDFVETRAENEAELQRILLANPQLIPARDLGLDGDLLVVGRETALASGYIDLLCLSKSGEVVIVEFKTGPQNPDFRHSLAQVIDYGSDLWKLGDWTAFDEGVVHRYLTGGHVDRRYRDCRDLRSAAERAWNLNQDEWDELTERLNDVVATGDFHFVVAAQRFTDTMRMSVSYLNETTRYGRYFLVEVIRLDGLNQTAYAAQVVQKPQARSAASSSSAARTSQESFLGAISDGRYREAMSELLTNAFALGFSTVWGSKGASIRLSTPDRSEPLSVGWVFLEGDQWTFAKHATFGVDPSTLPNHPSVHAQIERYCRDLKEIPGGKTVGSKDNAVMFEPHAFVEARSRIIALLGELSTGTRGE